MDKRYRITGDVKAEGAEFEVEDDATEEQIAQAALEVVIQELSYGWELVERVNREDEEDDDR